MADNAVECAEEWFLDQYLVDYLGSCLNSGTTPDPAWAPDACQRSQAKADAERLIDWLIIDGYRLIRLGA
jgi:hypothetical protein